jgi:hypothetical protein
MTTNTSTPTGNLMSTRTSAVAGLLLGALGIAVLWAGGVDFPVVVPPGLVILVVGAAVVTAFRTRWSAALACLLGMFILVGFVVSPSGFDNITGDLGFVVACGQAIEVVGVAVAAVSGALIAVRRG